jgi:hypothetical protein
MSNEITVLINQQSAPGPFDSGRKPGAGYHQKYDNLHTFVIDLSSWSGEIRIQGTLELFPGESSWVDLTDSLGTPLVYNAGFNPITVNVRGNFVWIRAVGSTAAGVIQQIQFSH